MNFLRKINWFKVTTILIIIVLGLKLFNKTLTAILNDRKKHMPDTFDDMELWPSEMLVIMSKRIQEAKLLDSSGEYNIVRDVWISSDLKPGKYAKDISIAVHTTVENMYRLFELPVFWKGTLSVAIFAPAQDSLVAIEYIVRLIRCAPVSQKIAFHLVIPITAPPRDIKFYDDEFDCVHSRKTMKPSSTTNYALKKFPYPNNLLRNVAFRNSHTEYNLVTDIDIVPSIGLRNAFQKFALKNKLYDKLKSDDPNIVYVLPIFETSNVFNIPYNMDEIRDQYKSNIIRPFYQEPCNNCQEKTDYNHWLSLNQSSSDDLASAYVIQWEYPYEPFFIARRNIPIYDERFKQYGLNRVSQICELHIAGYEFHVINNAFLVHLGFKKKTKFHPSKDIEHSKNKLLYQRFKVELATKYKDSPRKC